MGRGMRGMGCSMGYGMRGMKGMEMGMGGRFFRQPYSEEEINQFKKQQNLQKQQWRQEENEFKNELKEKNSQTNQNKENDYEEELDALSNLGFDDFEYNIQLLNSFNGDLEQTLNFLLQEQNQN
ncbi:ubiquitin family protein [Anaeramoeba flamelloides]|nr:ubiquitin family protein [Anaeramoeba flamelloides]